MKIFITDDDAMLRMVLADQLTEAGREIYEFENGKQVLAAIDQQPDLLLLDIEMPGMSGIEVCRAWRAAGWHKTQIIFISSLDNLEMRLAAYDAGANDYITKPVEASVLQCKVLIAESAAKIKRNPNYALITPLPLVVPPSADENETVVLQAFMREVFAAATTDNLVAVVFQTLHRLGLCGLIEVRQSFEIRRFSEQGLCSPLEASLLRYASKLDSNLCINQRQVINTPLLTLLVSVPRDLVRAQKLQDYLVLLAEAANIRLAALESEQQAALQYADIMQILVNIAASLESVQRKQALSNVRTDEVQSQFMQQQLETISCLGLNDRQEQALSELAQSMQNRLLVLRDMTDVANSELREVIGELRALLLKLPQQESAI